jgi:phage repressor protein C with HTH and peptisase S24 domain
MTGKKITETAESRSTSNDSANRATPETPDSKRPIPSKESGDLISRILEVIGNESISSFGRRCGITEGSLRSYINTGSKPPFDRVAAIARAGGVSMDWLASGRQPKFKPSDSAASRAEEPAEDYVVVPLYNNVQASAGAGALVDEEVADSFMRFSEEWLRVELGVRLRDLCLIRAIGDSMEPTFRSGDALLVDRSATNPDREGIYIMRSGASLLVKRLQLLPGGRIRVSGDNPLYPPYELLVSALGDDVSIIGRVVWSGRRL